MTELSFAQAQRLAAPAPFALLTTAALDGRVNVMAVSWWTFLSNRPPMLGVCLSKKGYSGTILRETGEFALNIVGGGQKNAALRCGQCSGKTVDKLKELSIPLEQARTIRPGIVAGSRAVFECRLVESMDVSDHVFYAAEVLACSGDPDIRQLFAWDGYSRLDTL